MFSPADPRSNFLLAALIDAGCDSVTCPENVEWRAGQSLYESGETQSHLYFSSDTVVSLQHILNSGSSSEFALVGNHGVVGVSLVLGSTSMPSRSAECQLGIQDPCAGDPRRRQASWADSAFAVEPHANPDHAGSAIGGVQPLCRFLLQRLNNLPTNELMITQEQIARLLGVR